MSRGCKCRAFWGIGGIRGCRDVMGVLGAGRDCRYSGTRRCIGGIRVEGAPRGCRGAVLGHQGCRVSGVYWDWQGLGTQGQKGYRVHQGHWGS